MDRLQVIYRNIDELNVHPGNARVHGKAQLRQLKRCIERFGFLVAVLIKEDGTIIAGHGRVEAARSLGMTSVPAITCTGLSDAEVRAFMIADNKLTENAEWDTVQLGIEFQALTVLDLDFDLTITGFETPEIDLLIEGIDEGRSNDAAEFVPVPKPGPTVTSAGDVWELGRHSIICASATDPEVYQRLLGNERVQAVFTDPPYNVPVDGHVCGSGKVRHREFAAASGEMTDDEYDGFLHSFMFLLDEYSADGAIHFICIDWRHIGQVLGAGGRVYTELKNICVWAKTNGGMGSFYRSQHELVAVFKSGTAKHINNVQLGRHGRNRTNLWTYPGISSMTAGRAEQLAMHPTVKPVDLVADALLDCSNRSGLVLDCFGGSGTTLIAAERTGRKARLIEIDPAYVDVTIRRWRRMTGDTARLAGSGVSFDACEEIMAETMEVDDAE